MQNLLLSLIAFAALIPEAAFAQEYLVNLPIGETATFNDYINAIYLMFISIAALIAVVKIIIAGVKYMFSDIVTQKSDAKRDIQGALLGLLVVLAAVVVLTVINPELTRFNPQITRITEQGRPVLPTNPSGQSIAGSDQVLQPGDRVQFIGFLREISSREECVEESGTVIPGSGTTPDRCLLRAETTSAQTGSSSAPLSVNITETEDQSGDVPLSRLSAYNPNTTYTVFDPADPALGLEAGPDHGSELTVVGPQRGDTIGVIGTSGTLSFTGCGTITPNVCQ